MPRRFSALSLALIASLILPPLSGTAIAQPAPPSPTGKTPKLTKAPKLVTYVEPVFPASERSTGKTSQVVLKIAISATGTVDAAEIQESGGAAFDEAAIAAARQLVFEPAEIDGKPAAIRILYKYDFVLREEKKITADLAGTVVDRETRKPLQGIRVQLDTGDAVTTGADGRFLFSEIKAGKHALTISGDGVTPLSTDEVVEEGKRSEVRYDLSVKKAGAKPDEQDDFEVVVVAPPLERQVVSVEVKADQGRKVPGAQGDVLKVVESMPGVGRSAVGSGALVVWGAAPQDTRVYVEGVRIPSLYHSGGVRSVIHSDLVSGVELVPGGYGATFGRGLGGLITVTTKPLENDGFHGSVSADLLDAAVMVRAPLTDKLRFTIAGRKSYLDSVLSSVTSRDIGEIVPIPKYHDAQARLVYELAPKETIEIGGMLSSDTVERTLTAANPADTKRDDKKLGFTRLFVRYSRTGDDGSVVTIVPSIGTESNHQSSKFGPTPTVLDVDSMSYALRASWRGRIAPRVGASVGLDTEVLRSTLHRSGSVTQPAREGDPKVFGQPPSDQINTDDWTTTIANIAPYGELDLSFADDSLHIIPGVRLEPYIVSGSRLTPVVGETPSIGFSTETTKVEPRLSIRYSPVPGVTAKAAYGVYHQAPLPDDLSAVFGNPLLGVSTAKHILAGGMFRLTDTITTEVTAFHSSSSDLAIRNPSSTPKLAQALVTGGLGRAFGAQLMVRRELASGFFGWVSYTMLRSERTDSPNGAYRLFDYDQSHVLTTLASYDLGRGVEVGARFRYSSGFPRTRVVGAYYDARRDVYDPIMGAKNGIRIPAFYQVDARISKRLKLAGTEAEIYLDVQNVTNHLNPEEIVYSHDYRTKSYITGLPILPVFGGRWSW